MLWIPGFPRQQLGLATGTEEALGGVWGARAGVLLRPCTRWASFSPSPLQLGLATGIRGAPGELGVWGAGYR